MTRVILSGYTGKLGRAIAEAMAESGAMEIVAGVAVDAGQTPCAFPAYTDIADCGVQADVVVDCTVAHVVPRVLDYAMKTKTPAVICTTGLDAACEAKLTEAAGIVPVFRAANLSLGVNLVAELLEKMTRVLATSGFDVEIVEKHHNKKLDAPSGTALVLADAVNAAADGVYEYVFDRSQVRQARGKKELGIHAVRGGTIVGEHSVIFAGKDEVVEIKHSAASKEVFATGAVKAVAYIVQKPAGLYGMRDLMADA